MLKHTNTLQMGSIFSNKLIDTYTRREWLIEKENELANDIALETKG